MIKFRYIRTGYYQVWRYFYWLGDLYKVQKKWVYTEIPETEPKVRERDLNKAKQKVREIYKYTNKRFILKCVTHKKDPTEIYISIKNKDNDLWHVYFTSGKPEKQVESITIQKIIKNATRFNQKLRLVLHDYDTGAERILETYEPKQVEPKSLIKDLALHIVENLTKRNK